MRTGILDRLRRDEQGISAIMVAVSLFAIFGMVMLAVDAGNLWSTRRNLITGTDSAALAEAKALAFSTIPPFGCDGIWEDLLLANAGAAATPEPPGCSVVSATGTTGYVSVQARKPAEVRFGRVLGAGDASIYSRSAAMWGIVNQPTGLRPIGLCLANGHVQDMLGLAVPPHLAGVDGDYAAPDGTGLVHHIPFSKIVGDECGNTVPGNFGWIDLDLRPPKSQTDLADWLRDGYYDNHVELDPSDQVGDCNSDNATGDEPCDGDTGAKSALKAALDYLVDPDGDGAKNPVTFPIVIYDTATGTGANAEFNLRGVVSVKLWDFDVKGAEASRFLDLQKVEALLEGLCCSAATDLDFGSRGVRLCAVDHDTAPAAVQAGRCLPS